MFCFVMSFERGTWLLTLKYSRFFCLLFLLKFANLVCCISVKSWLRWKNTAEAPLLCKQRTYEAVITSWIIPEALIHMKRNGNGLKELENRGLN